MLVLFNRKLFKLGLQEGGKEGLKGELELSV